jgi:hypothetical protein
MRLRTVSAALIVAGIWAAGARAQQGPVSGLPWLHEGMVLTNTWYAAVAPGTNSIFTEDANGDWIDQSSGQHFVRTDRQGTSGSGWTQTTIACIDGDKVVITNQSFGDAGALGNNVPVPLQGTTSLVTSVRQAADYWTDPASLANLRSGNGVDVSPANWKIGDRTYDAIRLQTFGNGYTDHVYDRKTGLCIHFASAVRGSQVPRELAPGETAQGDLTLTHGNFVSMRDLAIPWAGQPMPDAARQFQTMHWSGQTISRGPLPTVPNMVTLDLQVTDRGNGWVAVSATSALQMQGAPAIPPSTSQIVFGGSQFNGLWAAPAALSNLHEGQVLDDDPVTHMRLEVKKADGNSVVMSQSNPAGEIDSVYNTHTGMLTESSFLNVLSKQQLVLRVAGQN